MSTDAAADGFALLTLLVDPEDRPALRYWLGEHAQDRRWRPYARLATHCGQSGQSPRATLQAMAAGALTLPHTTSLVARFNILTQRLTAMMALDLATLVDTLFPDGNADLTSVRQVALLTIPNVNTPSELLDELRSAITQPELPGSQGPAVGRQYSFLCLAHVLPRQRGAGIKRTTPILRITFQSPKYPGVLEGHRRCKASAPLGMEFTAE